MAAIEVLNLRRKYPHIKLIMVLPCKDQSKYWNKADKNIYEFIKKQSDKVVYTSEFYKDKSCILDRNRLLIDNSSVCITYKTKNTGGTSYTINYAKEKNIFYKTKKEALASFLFLLFFNKRFTCHFFRLFNIH